ncbi:MAG: hypothetical protein AB1896_09755 [Thermodesulfobacteriota bacterium]
MSSGRCRIKGRDLLLVDRRLDTAARLEVLASELRRMDLGGIYIKPYLRSYLKGSENEWG